MRILKFSVGFGKALWPRLSWLWVGATLALVAVDVFGDLLESLLLLIS